MTKELPEIQHAIVEGDKDVWYYYFQGPQLIVWQNPYEPRFHQWLVAIYPNQQDFSLKRNFWYYEGFPHKENAFLLGVKKLRQITLFWMEQRK